MEQTKAVAAALRYVCYVKVPRVYGAGHSVRAAEDRGEWGGGCQ